jgi:bHLH factor
VERRRREAINEGINELSKIVPGCEKNKGSILQRAVQYIGQLKENEQQNIEKWTLEKLLLDQAITELSSTAERLKNDSKFYQRERDIFKRACEENGIVPPELKELENEGKSGTEE